MGIVIICVAISFVVLFVWLVVMTAKIRKEAQVLIKQIMAFGQKVNQGKLIFYCDDFSDTNLIDESGKSVPVLQEEFKTADKRCQIVLCGVTVNSNIPDKCYRVAYNGYKFVHDDFGQSTDQVNLCFWPADCHEEWLVTEISDSGVIHYITCRHQVMGVITVENRTGKHYEPGQKIVLHQKTQEAGNGRYIVNYEIA